MVSQTGCPFCSVHWNWYCLVTMVLPSQSANMGFVLTVLHWSSTTTDTKEDGFIRSPDASHTILKVPSSHWNNYALSPWGTMAWATSPVVLNWVVLQISLIVMSGHGWYSRCAFEKDTKARITTIMKGYSPLQRTLHCFTQYCGDSWSCSISVPMRSKGLHSTVIIIL